MYDNIGDACQVCMSFDTRFSKSPQLQQSQPTYKTSMRHTTSGTAYVLEGQLWLYIELEKQFASDS